MKTDPEFEVFENDTYNRYLTNIYAWFTLAMGVLAPPMAVSINIFVISVLFGASYTQALLAARIFSGSFLLFMAHQLRRLYTGKSNIFKEQPPNFVFYVLVPTPNSGKPSKKAKSVPQFD